jgi:hypothetical protein
MKLESCAFLLYYLRITEQQVMVELFALAGADGRTETIVFRNPTALSIGIIAPTEKGVCKLTDRVSN